MKNLALLICFSFFLLEAGSGTSFAQTVGLNFDGTDDVVQTKYSGIANNGARSIEAMIRTKANCDPNNKGRQHIIADYGVAKTGGRFTFNIMYNNAPRIEISGAGLNGQTPVNDGKWHHVAVVFDPSVKTNQLRLYVDGKLDTSGDLSTKILTANSTPFQIGERVDGVNNFEGEIDEVRFFDYARTEKEINTDMGREYCKIPKGLVAYYKLNEGNPGASNKGKTTATDHSGNKYHGQLNNFALSGSTSNWVTGSGIKGGNTSSEHDFFECYSYTSDQGNTYTSSGKYVEVIPNSSGCDSTITLNVTIGRSYNYGQYAACDSFVTPLGNVYYKSGLYRDTLFGGNAVKCDSIILMDVIVHQKIFTDEKVTDCDSSEIAGKWYFSDAKVELYGKAKTGCDSFHTIDLKIVPTTTFEIKETQCDRYKSPLGNTYTKTGLYKEKLTAANRYGCDSLILLDITINKSVNQNIPVTSCDSFVSPGGIAYHASGNYTERYSTSKGCDSVIVYALDLAKSKTNEDQVHECDSAMIDGQWYFSSDIIHLDKKTTSGCDSMVTIDLTITTIDTSVTRAGKKLTALQQDAKYQWIDCKDMKPISGATSISFEASYSGSFFVEIEKDGCTSSSSCFDLIGLGIAANALNNKIRIAPNPNNGNFVVSLDGNIQVQSYTIVDIAGKKTHLTEGIYANKVIVNQHLSPGVYFLQLNTDNGAVTEKFIVK